MVRFLDNLTLMSLTMLCFIVFAANETYADGAWRTTDIRGIHYAVERSDLHPGEWQNKLHHTGDCQAPCRVEFDDRMSALHLRYKWAQLNPSKGKYNFSDVGLVLDDIHAAGKMATIVVMAGKYTPAWVFEQGAAHLQTPAKASGLYTQSRVPLPWDPIFLREYQDTMTALSRYLHQKPSRYETVVLIKNGAVVVHSGETRLMPVKPFKVGQKVDKNNKTALDSFYDHICTDWARSGYSEGRIMYALRATNKHITTAFPDQYIGLAYVGGSKRFPTVDKNGKCLAKSTNKTMPNVIKDMVETYGPRAVINNTVLTPEMANVPIINWVKRRSGKFAFQVDRPIVGCRRSKPSSCDIDRFIKTIERGNALGSYFIEVHRGNVHRYKNLLVEINRKHRR